jgi:CspA family cold shock protein
MPWRYFDRVAGNYQKYMARGIVKWFNEKKGFGFIVDPAVNGDVFVHFSAIASTGWKTLKEGEEVEYELDEHQKGSRAKNVVRI